MLCCFRKKQIKIETQTIEAQSDRLQEQERIIKKLQNKIQEQDQIINTNIQTSPKYYTLLNNISNFRELSNSDKKCIIGLSKSNLLEIIYMYNVHIQNMNEWLKMHNRLIQ
jgi:hypothetical protein